MRATTTLSLSIAAGGQPAPTLSLRKRTYLLLRVRAAFSLAVALIGALTALAANQMQGVAATAAMVLGVAAIVVTLLIATWLVRSVVRPLRPTTNVLTRLAAGDLTGTIDLKNAGELRPLLEELQALQQRLRTVVGQVRSATSNVAMNVTQVTRDNTALSGRTDTQAESLQDTAASMEQLTAAVRQTAGTAQQAHALVDTARERAEQGGAVTRDMVETMESIRASAQSIRQIIGVIDGIAFQTNILALNAAVEAARAGEQGRGFAVVASEVRTLAQRSAEAAREIKSLIGASVEKVEAGGSRVAEAGRAMTEIVDAVRQVADLIAQINLASQEQSSGIENINTAIARIDSATQDNAALVQAATRTATALRDRVGVLTASVAAFQTGEREHANADEAVDLVRRGCEFLRAHGREAFLADVNRLEKGRFVHLDICLLVQDVRDGVFVAHGNNPGRIGTGPGLKDLDGKPFALEFARVARERGEGWVDYKWQHSVTREVLMKTSYVRREGDLVIACPIYKS
jgi:methyl-accepting chemotaxis protein